MPDQAAFRANILIVGAGVSSLITAKTLLEDGYSNLHIITSGDRVGGVWASGNTGGVYPGLLTNSGHGNFEFSALDMPKVDLDKTEGRIKAETITDYLEEFYRKFIEGQLTVRFGEKVVFLDRPESQVGWIVRTEHVSTGSITEELWDKVILAQGPHSNPSFPDNIEASSGFRGILKHSSQIHEEVDAEILALPPTSSRVLIIGMGKSSIDLAARYASFGKEVTIVYKEPKIFGGSSTQGDKIVKSRIISTLQPNQDLRNWAEYLIHKTPLGSLWLYWWFQKSDKATSTAFKVTPESPLYREDNRAPIWRGPEALGGRSSFSPTSFHSLVHSGIIKCIPKAHPLRISDNKTGLVLSNGETIDADVVILGTGFKSSFDFIPLPRRIQLGLEPVPTTTTPQSNPIKGYWTLRNPPAPPNEFDAPEVYKGLVPIGAFEKRDLVLNGFAFLLVLGCPYTAELASHWISSFLSSDPTLSLPPSPSHALSIIHSHSNWLRARFPSTRLPWDLVKWAPLFNAQQFNDGLLEDMRVRVWRQGWGLFGSGYYTVGLLLPQPPVLPLPPRPFESDSGRRFAEPTLVGEGAS